MSRPAQASLNPGLLYVLDGSGNPIPATQAMLSGSGSGSATGPGTAAAATRVTYSSDGATVPVSTSGDVITATPTLDTVAYASGDVLFNPVALTNAARVNGGALILQSLTILDKDDQGAAMDLFMSQANNNLGTINTAPNISDTNAENLHYVGQIAATDWIDLGGCRVATLRNIGLQVEAAAGSRDVFLCAITRGTPTHTAAGIVIRAGVVQF